MNGNWGDDRVKLFPGFCGFRSGCWRLQGAEPALVFLSARCTPIQGDPQLNAEARPGALDRDENAPARAVGLSPEGKRERGRRAALNIEPNWSPGQRRPTPSGQKHRRARKQRGGDRHRAALQRQAYRQQGFLCREPSVRLPARLCASWIRQVLLQAASIYMDYLRDAAVLEVQRANVRVLERTLRQVERSLQYRRCDAHRRRAVRSSAGGRQDKGS